MPAVMAILITHEDVPEQQIYDFVSSMFKNADDIAAVHARVRKSHLRALATTDF